MTGPGSIYTPAASPVRGFADGVAWLWRLGPLRERPDPSAVGLGWLDDAAELKALVDGGRLAGAAVFANRPGPGDEALPSRGRVTGVASFGSGRRVFGQFCVLQGGEAAVRSSLGVHAIREGRWMVVGADPAASWGSLDAHWVLPALADFLAEALPRPLVMLPALGWVRYDDLPGTAYHQIAGNDKSDAKVRRRIESAARLFAENNACLNVAIASRALVDGRESAVDEVWPRAIAAIGGAVESGTVEPVCHGYMHLDTEALAAGEIDPREFRNVDRAEAGRRLDVSLAWFEGALGSRPRTFVAPTWGYGEGLMEALTERDLPAWLPPRPGPLIANGHGRETLTSAMDGLFRLDYGPLGALAHAGLPPSVVVHGGLFDSRLFMLRKLREIPTTARLVLRRDLFRFPWVSGVRWIGAGELLDRLRGHGQIEMSDGRISNPAGFDVLVRDRNGARLVSS